MREKLIHELEEERRLRLDSEKRLREVTEESELGRVQMVLLQQHFSRMEETVRSLLQNQGAVDTMDIMKAYKDKLSEEAHKQHDGPEEEHRSPPAPADPQSSDPVSVPSAETDGGQSEEERDKTNYLLERLKALEDQNSALASENETQRQQYERCLDEVANQVVQALLTQKDLREECLKLRTRVFDLEQQNRTMSILFQQRVKPASDLLLQKLHSRIMDLSAADLLLEPERGKGGLLSRNADSSSHEVQPNGKAYLPAKCLSQSSLSAAAPVYPRSSCSSSELSLSSACSEYSSGSYTWNDGRSCGKMSSLTWEKRLSLGSSAPSNICAPSEEQLPTRRAKESHILEGLRKLQRRKHRSSSASSRVSKSGEKDCMNSNEGIYSLGIKSSSKGVCKPPYVGRAVALGLGVKRFSYDSDDADDELAHAGQRDNVPCRDSWFSCQTKLSRSISDSLCSWEGLQDNGAEGDVSTGGTDSKPPPSYDSKERPERLMSFISNFLSGGVGGRTSAFSKPTKLHHVQPADPEVPLHSSDLEDTVESAFESGDICPSVGHTAQQLDKDAKRPSRDPTKLLMQQCSRRDQGRTQSADGRPRPFSLIKEPRGGQFAKSEESLLAIFDAEGQPIELSTQTLSTGAGPRNDILNSKAAVDYTQLVSQERPTRQKVGNGRNYSALESPEKPSEYQSKQSKTNKASNSNEGSAARLVHLTPQKKLIKPLSTHANKGHPILPISESTTSKSNSSKIPGRNKPTASPLRVSKGSSTEPGNTVNSNQEKSPSSPPVKLSRYIKPSGGSCVQSPKAVSAKLPGRSDWSKCGTSGSPQPSRRHLEHVDGIEQPTRDEHCETSKNKLRSPSPPLPPGRTTSLLIRPNYEGSPQTHKMGVAQTPAPTTVRGPPPSYHPPPVPNMQATLPIKGHESVDFDAGYGTALAPQKLVDKTGQHLPKSSTVTQTPSKGTYKRTPVKYYLSSATSGCPPESENAPKGSRNGPPPYGALRGTSLQGSFVSKRGSVHEHVIQPTHKTSTGLPVSLQDQPLCNIEPQDSKLVTQQAVASPPTSAVMSPNAVEKTSKTRIPMGFKAFLKSPPAHKSGQSVPGKHEKDHINSVSKETVTFNASTQCDRLQPENNIDSSAKSSITEGKGDVQGRSLEGEPHSAVLLEEGGEVCDKGKRSSQLFLRSISVTTKPHLKPALGMNGAKARSQSFSTNYMEKPNISVPDGQGKIRTQIITNSGERGNSLSRQSSMEVPSNASSVESPAHCSRNRLSLYGGLTGSNSHGILPDRTSKSSSKVEWSQSTMKGEVITHQPQKEARSLPITDRIGLKNSRKPAKVTSYPQFQSTSSHVYDPNTTLVLADVATSPNKPDVSWVIKAQSGSSSEVPDIEEKKVISPTACTIEEKVMMGIEENLQKCQEQEKVTAAETKQKTGPSLANWFGLRKSKLPALNAKKTDSPKGKEEKKELKIGSVLGGKQAKSDKKKDKKKNDNQCKDSHEEQNLTETNNKLSSIMDQCNIQMGQIASQIQCTTAYFGKDQFMKEFLGRTAVKGDSLGPSLAAISIPKHAEMRGDMEICTDTATIIMTQKINPRTENEEALVPDPTCQDHMIGSGCQMRTLDSGIGTFPLPDSVTRASSRHVPKSESSPDRISGVAGEPGRGVPSLAASPRHHQPHLHPTTPPDVKVPSLPKSRLPCLPGTLGHSLSDPTVTLSSQSRLPKPTTTDVIRSKRLSQSEPRSPSSSSMEAHEKAIQRMAKIKDHDLARDRTLRVCTYPGSSSSSSDSDTEAESSESTLGSPQKTLIHQPKKSNSVDQNEEETLKRSSVERSLSIMDYYQHDMFSHMEKDSRRISQYNLLHKESQLDGKAGDRLSKEIPLERTSDSSVQPRGSLSISLESLNKLNHGGSGGGSGGSGSEGLYPDTGPGRRGDLGHRDVMRTSADDSCGADEAPPSSSPSFSCKPGADPAGSLSDSLYDSFSSCTSQGSNDV